MKNLVRRGGKLLEQIVRRNREVDAYYSRVKGGIVVNRLTSLRGYHNSGPLIYECRRYMNVDWLINFKKCNTAGGPYEIRSLTTAF